MKHICSALKRNGEKGFTLVELIVVIAILAILAAVAYPVYNGYIDYTHKGVDRQTVGEIMHAIELANYDDPTLIKGGESVYISGADGSGTTSLIPALDTALERALGDLSTVKLTYDGWKLDDNASLKNVADNILIGENVKAYWEMIGDGKATYAENIDGMWTAFSALTKTSDWTKDNFQKAIDLSNDSTKKETLIQHWKDGTTFSDLGGGTNGNAYLALEVARNYSFVSFVEKYHPEMLTGAAKEEFDSFKNTCGDWGKNRLLLTYQATIQGEEEKGLQTLDYDLKAIGFNDSRWKEILEEYYNDYAATDAQGYLAMMEATKTIGTTMEDPTSDDYFNELEKHLGILSAALNQGQEATTQALNFTGKFATIQIVKNADGSITCKPWPSDLDPRDQGGSGNTNAEPEEKIEVTTEVKIDYESGSLTTAPAQGILAVNKDDSYTIKKANITGFPDNAKVTSITVNSTTASIGSDTVKKEAILENGKANITLSNAGVPQVKFTGTTPGHSTVTLTLNFDGGKTISVSFEFYVLEAA